VAINQEVQLAYMHDHSKPMLEVMQNQNAVFQKLQPQDTKVASTPAPEKKPLNQRRHGVNRGRRAVVYASSKRAHRAAAKRKRTPVAEIRHFNTEEEACAWVDGSPDSSAYSDSLSSSESEDKKTGLKDGGAGDRDGGPDDMESEETSKNSKQKRRQGAIPTAEDPKPFVFTHGDKIRG
jgi:hypothetical protein